MSMRLVHRLQVYEEVIRQHMPCKNGVTSLRLGQMRLERAKSPRRQPIEMQSIVCH